MAAEITKDDIADALKEIMYRHAEPIRIPTTNPRGGISIDIIAEELYQWLKGKENRAEVIAEMMDRELFEKYPGLRVEFYILPSKHGYPACRLYTENYELDYPYRHLSGAFGESFAAALHRAIEIADDEEAKRWRK